MKHARPLQFDQGAADKWARLVRQARLVAADPLADASRLGSAAMKAGKAASIPGQHERGSAGYELVQLGRRFAGLQGSQRAADASRLGYLAERVDQALGLAIERMKGGASAPSIPARPYRADIDG